MSRILGDALVGGPEAGSVPEMVTVRITRGQAEALAASAESVSGDLMTGGFSEQSSYLFAARTALLSQIGGPR